MSGPGRAEGSAARIAGRLDELLAAGRDGTAALVGPLADALLLGLAEGRFTVPAVRHPLGFLYAPLRRGPGAALRLHLWPARPHWRTLTTSPYHMHAWDLVSYVHLGTVRNTTVEVAPCPGDEGFRLFDVRGEGNEDRLTPSSRTVRISGRSDETLPAGSFYRLGAGVFHTTAVTGPGGAVTLARVTPVPGAGERVLGPRELGGHRTIRTPGSPEEVARTARHLLADREGADAPRTPLD